VRRLHRSRRRFCAAVGEDGEPDRRLGGWPAPKDQSTGYGEFFLDADHAWVVDTVGSARACADHFVVYATANGGSSWRQVASTTVTQLSGDDALAGTWNVSVEFVNPQVGWIYVQPVRFTIATNVLSVLYQTTDGGHRWTVVASPASWTAGDCAGSGLPYVSSPTTWWIGAMCSGAARSSIDILVTRDAGQTWTNIEFAKNFCTAPAYPDGCPGTGSPLPQFIDENNGWWMNPDGSPLLVTSDGGQTWKPVGLPHFSYIPCQGKYGPTTCPTLYFGPATFLNSSEGWLLAADGTGNGPALGTHVERTLDGGRHWTVLYTTADDWLGVITFVDPQNGFIWTGQDLFRTTNGGRTWAHVHITYS
jgi:photosystem II stability/assembly factor-like uncharacterized protein